MAEESDFPATTLALGELTDALARGRLTMAELAAIAPLELETLFEVGAMRLDTHRLDDAVAVFSGLVSLFPYSAKTWRAYGIALHRSVELQRARAAYDAALLLEPDHLVTLCYRAEVLLYLGERERARNDLEMVRGGARQDLRLRAEGLLSFMEALAHWSPQEPPPPRDQRADPFQEFQLADGRPLPLERSPFADAVEEEIATSWQHDAVTATAQTMAQEVADLWEPSLPQASPPKTNSTHSLDQRPGASNLREITAPVEPPQAGDDRWEFVPTSTTQRITDHDITQTLAGTDARPQARTTRPKLRRMTIPVRDITETAIIPGRPRAIQIRDEARRGLNERDAAAPTREVTQTAVVRRREHLPLCEETTLTSSNMGESEWSR